MPTVAYLYMLKDLSRLSGHSIHTLKFYLKLGLIREVGRSPETRFRYFDDSTLASLAQIRAHRKQEKSLAQIAQLLAEQSQAETATLSPHASHLTPLT